LTAASQLEILYQDSHFIAVNKPHGLLVHRSSIADDADEFAVQILRDQIGKYVYPVHRLDRKTSGVLLFALNEEMNSAMQIMFAKREVTKKYIAVVRGYTDQEGTIDYPLKKENGTVQEAVTHYRTIEQKELPIPFGKNNSVRYSLVEVSPVTGRMHQIRRHFAHILHPIIGDRPYGCNKQNRFFLEKWNFKTMMLHSRSLEFRHPGSGEIIKIEAGLRKEFKEMAALLGFKLDHGSQFTDHS
jgi:tRNA pseudouridine65 synthase